jgi:glycosyltransferase involved in cell wall biosynthesis
MKIGVVSSIAEPVPPFEGYGGTQRGVYDLANGLVDRGHEVVVLASGDSTIGDRDGIRLVPVVESSLRQRGLVGEARFEAIMEAQGNTIQAVADLVIRNELDVVNLHWENPDVAAAIAKMAVPLVVSLSYISTPRIQRIIDEAPEHVAITAVSLSHTRNLKAGRRVEAVPYGIDMSGISFSPKSLIGSSEEPTIPLLQKLKQQGTDYVLHLGTISAMKGQASSIEIARQAGVPLVLAGAAHPGDPSAGSYFLERIQPHIDGKSVHYFGAAGEQSKHELMRLARATLFCSGLEAYCPEPFGRVLAESTAGGTPVVGYGHGSFPELIKEGVMGLSFDNVDEAAGCLAGVGNIDRTACAMLARQRLSSDRYVARVEQIFSRVIA